MKNPIPWNDLALFAAVARTGALARAAAETGTSTATLSRRMTALESRLARRLFRHGPHGYAVTPDGADLLALAERMEAAATDIAGWQGAPSGPPRVRISAGTWTADMLAENVLAYWSSDAPWVPEFVHNDRNMDIARREIDIGIRNRRPEQPWLAGRRIRPVHYAVYGQPDAKGWIGASSDATQTPSAAWVARNHGDEIVTTVNDPRLAARLAESGLGRVVLPCFAGDARPLQRLSDPIDALTHDQWLVCHHDARHDAPIRQALDALAAYLTR
ncbi:MAG: LysR family transcriptional regulator [Pseudomonadota bacterium]